VIVPCYNEHRHIESAIRSILAQKPPAGGFEIIVADGISGDGTREILSDIARGEPRLTVIDNPGRIVSTALNEGIRHARGKIIIRMDSHTTYADDYIQRCVEVLQQTNADNVGGAWVATGSGLMGEAIAAAFQSPYAVGGAKGHDPNCEGHVDTVYLGCWPREVFQRFGLFDEELVRNQDDEFNLRIRRGGGRIWQSRKIRSWYHPRKTLNELFSQYLQYGYWKVRVLQKHRVPASMRHLIPGLFVFAVILLPMLSILVPSAIWLWSALLATYLCCNVLAAVVTARRHETRLRFVLPVVFACFHVAYGLGFLRGFFDFVLMRRKPANAYTRLTRSQTIQ
jgi:glycosyltransferase involved in cell wall biosynthesis